MADLALSDLVANGTMSSEIAATLAETVAAHRSFLVFAIPRMAGKTTVMKAMLAQVDRSLPVTVVSGDEHEMRELERRKIGGYLALPEISQAPVPGYRWGAPVRRIFGALDAGYALATALHAAGIREAFEVITQGNGVPDAQAARIELAVYLELHGTWERPIRRVAEVHQILSVRNGLPETRLRHRWDETRDAFVDA